MNREEEAEIRRIKRLKYIKGILERDEDRLVNAAYIEKQEEARKKGEFLL